MRGHNDDISLEVTLRTLLFGSRLDSNISTFHTIKSIAYSFLVSEPVHF